MPLLCNWFSTTGFNVKVFNVQALWLPCLPGIGSSWWHRYADPELLWRHQCYHLRWTSPCHCSAQSLGTRHDPEKKKENYLSHTKPKPVLENKRLWFVDTVLWLCPSQSMKIKMAFIAAHLKSGSFWWWRWSNKYVISLLPHLRTPFPLFSPSLISLMVSVDIKHHVYLLTY